METNNFEQQIVANEQAQKHAQEIQQTRIGGLGGSDAAIVYKIGLNGLKALTNTDMKRLAVMTGKIEQDNWGGNAYTNAGHLFEDYAESVLPFDGPYEREKVIEQKLAHNFKTFAHADFVSYAKGTTNMIVIECKFVQEPTEKVAEKYSAQLQWYYALGAKNVMLYHGTGTVEPFEVAECFTQFIERDENTIAILLNGIKILDEALSKGWEPDACEKSRIKFDTGSGAESVRQSGRDKSTGNRNKNAQR